MGFYRLTQSDVDDIRRMTEEKKSTREIAEWIGCSTATVNAHRCKMGLEYDKAPSRYWTVDKVNELVEAYNAGVSYDELERMFGRSRESLRERITILRTLGMITTRRKPGRKRKSDAGT